MLHLVVMPQALIVTVVLISIYYGLRKAAATAILRQRTALRRDEMTPIMTSTRGV